MSTEFDRMRAKSAIRNTKCDPDMFPKLVDLVADLIAKSQLATEIARDQAAQSPEPPIPSDNTNKLYKKRGRGDSKACEMKATPIGMETYFKKKIDPVGSERDIELEIGKRHQITRTTVRRHEANVEPYLDALSKKVGGFVRLRTLINSKGKLEGVILDSAMDECFPALRHDFSDVDQEALAMLDQLANQGSVVAFKPFFADVEEKLKKQLHFAGRVRFFAEDYED